MLYGQKSKMCSSAVRTVGVSSNVLCFVFYVAVRMGALNCAIRSQLSPRASAMPLERQLADRSSVSVKLEMTAIVLGAHLRQMRHPPEKKHTAPPSFQELFVSLQMIYKVGEPITEGINQSIYE